MRYFRWFFTSFLLLTTGTLLAQPTEPEVIDAGALKLHIYISRTAHLFHIVDQLSEWSEFCHPQYRQYFQGLPGGLSNRDQQLLIKHAELRKVLTWGEGLEQTFYTSLDLDAALDRGISCGYLTKQQAEVEREVFTHFATRIESLILQEKKTLISFRQRIHDKENELREFAEKLSYFCGYVKVSVPMYLITNPSPNMVGGGYNGKRLTLEIPSNCDAFPSLLHELTHSFLETQRSHFEKAVQNINELDCMTLNEGIAYAISPGLFHVSTGDPLLRRVKEDLLAGKPLSDNYTRFNRFGLALRPLLRKALEEDQQTLDEFLLRAVDAWCVLVEFDRIYRTKLKHIGWFSAGPGWKTLASLPHAPSYKFSRKHTEHGYNSILVNAEKGSKLFLLFALDHEDRKVPNIYHDLLPMPWLEIEKALKRGETLELRSYARNLEIILLAAPTTKALEELIQNTKLTH